MRINAEDVKYFGREIIAERTLKEMSRALAEEIVKFMDLETVTVNDFKQSKNHFDVATGQAFCQGIFLPYGVTVDDNADGVRVGGLGSTDKQ